MISLPDIINEEKHPVYVQAYVDDSKHIAQIDAVANYLKHN